MNLSRIAGLLYLPPFVLGPFSLLYVRGELLVPDDAAATASRVAEHSGLLRAGSLGEVYLALTDVVLAALFYLLFRPGNRPLALVTALLRFSWAVVASIAVVTNLAALRLAAQGDTDGPLLLLNLHEDLLAVGFVAFGAHVALLGVLGWRDRVMPRILSILLGLAGVGYVVHSIVALGWETSPFALLLPAFPAEIGLALWLLIKGVPNKQTQPTPALVKEYR